MLSRLLLLAVPLSIIGGLTGCTGSQETTGKPIVANAIHFRAGHTVAIPTAVQKSTAQSSEGWAIVQIGAIKARKEVIRPIVRN